MRVTSTYYRSKIPVFTAPADTLFRKVDQTYAVEVCDICGKKRNCWWLEFTDISTLTGCDCCNTCLKRNFEEVKEE